MLTTLLKPFDTIVNIATTSSSFTISATGTRLIAIPISAATLCGLSISNKVFYEIIMQEWNKYKNQHQKDQQTIKPFDKLYRKSVQDKVIEKYEHESLCNILARYVDETKNESFLKIWTWI